MNKPAGSDGDSVQSPGWVDSLTRTLGEKTSNVFLLAVALTFYEVVLRYFFNAPTTWVHEVSIFLTATAFIMGGSYTLQRKDHIRISLVIDSVPESTRRWLTVINLIVARWHTARRFRRKNRLPSWNAREQRPTCRFR